MIYGVCSPYAYVCERVRMFKCGFDDDDVDASVYAPLMHCTALWLDICAVRRTNANDRTAKPANMYKCACA